MSKLTEKQMRKLVERGHDPDEVAAGRPLPAKLRELIAELDNVAEMDSGRFDAYTRMLARRVIAEIVRMREALQIIAGDKQCADNLMGNADIARAALSSGATE